jgi:hypothetical protein
VAVSYLAIITNQISCRSSCWCRRTISRKRRRTRLRTTAPPMRPEVTNPARHGPEFSIGSTFNIRSLPRCVIPPRFTRSYSERCVRRRVFGNENELTFVVYVAKTFVCERAASRRSRDCEPPLSTKQIFHRKSGEDFSKEKSSSLIQGATRQVIPRRQPVLQWYQSANQWWQLELPLQRDSSLQSPQAAGSWELDLSQE